MVTVGSNRTMRSDRARARAQADSVTAYTVIARRWNDGWDVFILHPGRGLIGQTRSESRKGIERAARAYLSEGNVAEGVKIQVMAR
jgi:hypothetical protein